MKIIKRKFIKIIVIILSILILSGCQQEPKNGKVIYFKGELINNIIMRQYIDLAKQYWDKIAGLGDKPRGNILNNDDNEGINLLFRINYNRARKYVEYSDMEWQNEYLKTLIVEKKLYDSVPIMKEEVSSIVDQYVKQIRENGSVMYIDESDLELKGLLIDISNKYSISYDTCINTVFRSFYGSMCADEALMYYYIDHGYNGKKVEWNGNNFSEYKPFVMDLYAQYDEYTKELLEQANIVEKQQ